MRTSVMGGCISINLIPLLSTYTRTFHVFSFIWIFFSFALALPSHIYSAISLKNILDIEPGSTHIKNDRRVR